MKVAVTGGSGVVGATVVRHLVDAGHDVRALARATSSESKLTSLGATPIPGHVLDPESLKTLVGGCEWVFHIAGVNEMCSRDPVRMWRVNVEGTRLVMNACLHAGVARMIHTSSAVTIGEKKGAVATEHSPHRGWYLSEYERTKAEAERLAFKEARGLEVVAVNPSSVQGPGRATGTGAILLNLVRGRLPFVIDTTISLVDINDCARGHLLAAERGVTGDRYLLSGATLKMREAVSLLAEVIGHDLTPRYLRRWTVMALGAVVEAGFRLARRQPPICRETVRMMSFGHNYDGSRATTELGLRYTAVEETLKRTIEWFEAEGLLAVN